jgi:hypothetical protein
MPNPANASYGQPFDAVAIFGGDEPLPEPALRFRNIAIESLKEFDGHIVDPALVHRVNGRIVALQKIHMEL